MTNLIGTTGGLTEIEIDQIDELIDVEILSPTNGQILSYLNGVWVNTSAGSGSGSVSSVSAGIGLTATPNPIVGTGEIRLANTAVSAGNYTLASISVDAQGRITAASNGAAGSGTVTSVSAGVGLSASPNPITGSGEIFLTNTAVSAGSYTVTSITVDAQGRITAASNGVAGAGTVTSVSAGGGLTASTNPITNTGDISIANTAVSAGSYTYASLTVNARGQITTASNGTSPVTSVAVSGKNGITVAGSPITSTGTIDLGLGAITPTSISTGVVSASTLNVTGDIQAATGKVTASAATISGKLSGATAVFSGLVSADAGINTTVVSGASINVTGDVRALTGRVFGSAGTFSGIVSASTVNVTSDIQAATGRVTASAATISGLLTGATATFSGIVSANAGLNATTGNFSGLLTGATATFSGLVSANAGLRATTVSASGVIGASNLSGNNTGDQTITLTNDVSGSGTGSITATIQKLSNYTTNGFVKTGSNNGTISIDTNTYLTGNQTITISGDVSGSGTTGITAAVTRIQGIQVKAGTPSDGNVLSYNTSAANWEASPAAATGVTSVSAGFGLTATPNPITGAGAVQLNIANQNGWTGQQYFAMATLTDASAVSWNAATQQMAQLSIAGAGRVLQNPTNMQNGATYILFVISAIGSAGLTYDTAYKWPGGTAPIITAASGSTSVLTFVCRSSAMYGVPALNFL